MKTKPKTKKQSWQNDRRRGTDDEIIQRHARGEQVAKIAREMGLARTMIYWRLKQRGIDPKHRPPPAHWSAGEMSVLRRMLDDGAKRSDIYKALATRSPGAIRTKIWEIKRGRSGKGARYN